MTGETERFPVVKISAAAGELVSEYASAVWGHATTQGSRKVVDDAYAHLCVNKKSLAEYISKLEEHCGIVREITLRF
jgi:hypothetical protein